MSRFGAAALPAYFAVTLAALAGFMGLRLLLRQRPRPASAPFHPMLRTTPAALELLPETESPASEFTTHDKEIR
jgi:hypothetical protein